MRRARIGALPEALAGLCLALGVAAGCAEPLTTESGLVVEVDSPGIGRVDGFVLRTTDGRRLAMDTRELAFRPEFPAAHLAEHQRLAEPVRVTFRHEGDRRVVVRLADERASVP